MVGGGLRKLRRKYKEIGSLRDSLADFSYNLVPNKYPATFMVLWLLLQAFQTELLGGLGRVFGGCI